MTTRRYAEGTTVPVERSRSELTTILARHRCERMAWATAPEGDTLQFELGGRMYRFEIRRPTTGEMGARAKADGAYMPQVDLAGRVDKEWRRRWRAHVLLLKAKLEFVDGGDTTLEREFLPHLVIADGRATLGQWLETDQGQRLLGPGRP